MQEENKPKQSVDFYHDGEKEVLVALDFATMRWIVFNMIASYIRKLDDRLAVVARGNDRNDLRSQIAMLQAVGAQLLQLADVVENGPPEEYTVKLVEG